MQALSIWPPKADPSVVTQLEFELGSSCNSIKRRKNPSPLSVSSNSRAINSCGSSSSSSSRVCFRNPILDFGCGSLYRCSTIKSYVFCEPNRDSFGASVATLEPEEQELGSEVLIEDSSSLTGLSESEGFNGSEQTNLIVNEKNGHRNSKEESVKEKKSSRINIRALGFSLRSAKTANDVEEVLKNLGEVPPQVYSSLIRGFGKDNRVDSALALFEWLKKKKKENSNGITGTNLFIYNSLLGALKEAEKYKQVENVVNDMAIEGVSPNIVTYNTLMGIYLDQGKEIEALNIFEEMETKGLSPSSTSYSTVLLAYRRLEDGFGALRFYVNIREKYRNGEIVKDVNEDWENEFAELEDFIVRICYQVMRRWLVKRENLSTNVLKLLSDMDKASLRTGRAEHERLVWACTREEHYVVAKELYNRIRERDSEISLSVCNHVIWVMGKAKKWWAALEIYEDLLDRGPKPNNISYELVVSHFNTLLTAARRKGIWKWGVRLLNKMEEKGLKPGSQEWNSVLVACSKASETTAAVQIFKRMVEQGEKPNVVSYGALLSALEKGKLYNEAIQVWKHMLKVGIEPNLYAYTIMASVYAAQGKFDIVESIIKEMKMFGVGPTVVTFNAIITASARNNYGNVAYEWFQRMKAENVAPNEVSYEMLIEALSNNGKPRLAYDLYMRAYNEGLSLSSKVYDAVVRSKEVYGASMNVGVMGPRPPEKAKKVRIRKSLKEFCNLADVPKRGKPFERKEIYSPQTEGNL